MTLCLFAICLVCSGLLAGVYALTEKPIDKAEKEKNEKAIMAVLPPVDSIGALDTIKVTIGKDTMFTYNPGFDKNGKIVGYAINVAPIGFGGPIEMKVGFKVDTLTNHITIWNTKVLKHAETPGLGAKCTDTTFTNQFMQQSSDTLKLKVTKSKEPNCIDAITASTITSAAYTKGVQIALNVLNEILDKSNEEDPIREVLPQTVKTIREKMTVKMGEETYTYNIGYGINKDDIVGYAVNVCTPGFGGEMLIKVGFDVNGTILNTKVLQHSESPDYGAKCEEPAFAGQFKNLDPREKTWGIKRDGGDLDAITGSTVTSRAYVNAIEKAVYVFATITRTPIELDSCTGASMN